MSKFKGLVGCVFILLLLAMSTTLFAYDTSPANLKIIPEGIWAAASGGGTWTTEVQIYARNTTNPVNLNVWFFPAGEAMRGPFTLTGLTVQHMTRYSNILQTIDGLDASANVYYGKVGAVWFQTVDADDKIQVQARTLHSGGYGKTMNALNFYTDADSAYFTTWRGLMIQGITQSSTYRSSIGLFNPSSTPITVQVALIYYTDSWLGYENITLASGQFLAFDVFSRFGLTGTYTNCRVWINPTSGTGRCMAFGASANNTTNDPAAHIAAQYD